MSSINVEGVGEDKLSGSGVQHALEKGKRAIDGWRSDASGLQLRLVALDHFRSDAVQTHRAKSRQHVAIP